MKYIVEWRKFRMMNDKDLQRKTKEQQIKKLMNELLDSYEDELPKIDEKMAKKIKMAKKNNNG